MKLKTLVVASMSAFALMSLSAPAMAHHGKHRMAQKHEMTTQTNYKGLGALPVCPINDPYTATLEIMGQNVGRAKPTEDCMKLISFAGGINFDAHWGNRSYGYQGENNQRLSLNDAYLNIFGNVNDWVKAFASLSYNNASDNSAADSNAYQRKAGQYSSVYPTQTLTLEQGIIRFADFDEWPVFVQLGKKFQDFGRYMIHPITRSTTQVLSESLQTSAEIGFITHNGFHGTLFAFDNPLVTRNVNLSLATTVGHTQTNYGAALGYDNINEQLGYGINLAYMHNMTGVNDVAQAVSWYQFNTNTGGSYFDTVGAMALNANLNSGPFSVLFGYVTAIESFATGDLQDQGKNIVAAGAGSGAKPWAGNIQAGYGFNAWNKLNNIYVGYQASGQAVNIFLPQSRWLVGYNIDMWKNTNLGLEVAHDNDYGTSKGGTGQSSNTIAARAAVKFG